MGRYKFDHTVIVWKEGDNYYQSNSSAKTESFDLDNLPVTMPIPIHILKGRWHASVA
jgi:hypothetical protein